MKDLTIKEKEVWVKFAEAEAAAAKIYDKAVDQAKRAEKKAMAPIEAIVKENRCAANEEFNKVTAKAYDKERRASGLAYKAYNKSIEPARQIRDTAICATNKMFSQARAAAIDERETLVIIARKEYELTRNKAAKERDAALRRAK